MRALRLECPPAHRLPERLIPTRRNVLLGLLGLVVASAGGLRVFERSRRREPEELVLQVILDRFGYLKIADEDLARFAVEYVRRERPSDWTLLGDLPHRRGGDSAADGVRAAERRNLERTIAARFLLATDVFRTGGGPIEGGRARFVAWPDPYTLGCANPLARF